MSADAAARAHHERTSEARPLNPPRTVNNSMGTSRPFREKRSASCCCFLLSKKNQHATTSRVVVTDSFYTPVTTAYRRTFPREVVRDSAVPVAHVRPPRDLWRANVSLFDKTWSYFVYIYRVCPSPCCFCALSSALPSPAARTGRERTVKRAV